MIVRYGENAVLIVMFNVAEQEEAIFHYRASSTESELAASEKRIGILRIPAESGIRCQIVVPVIEEQLAVNLVGTASGNDVHGAASCGARGQIKIEARYLKFLHTLLGYVERRSPVDSIVYRRTIHRDPCFQKLRSRLRRHVDSYFQTRQGSRPIRRSRRARDVQARESS